MSRSSRSSTSSARGPSTSTSASRRPDTATTSPGSSVSSGPASRMPSPRRTRWMNNRCSGNFVSAAVTDRPAIGAPLRDPVCTQFKPMPGGGDPRCAGDSQFLFQLERLGGQVDAKQSRTDDAAEQNDAEGAEDVADCVSHRDVRHKPRPFSLGQRQGVDRLRRCTHGRALGQCARDKPGSKAGIETKGRGDDDCGEEPGHTYDHCEQHRPQPVSLQRLQELRSDRIADAEEKQEEQKRLRHCRDRDIGELADQDAGKKRAGDGSEAEASELYAADQVSDADRKEHGQLRILDQELLDPRHEAEPPLPWANYRPTAALPLVLPATASGFSSFSPLAFS